MTTENPEHVLLIVDTKGLLAELAPRATAPNSPADLDHRHFCILHSPPKTHAPLLVDAPRLTIEAGKTLLLRVVPVALLGEEILFSHSPASTPPLAIELIEQHNVQLALAEASTPLQPSSGEVADYHWQLRSDQPGNFKLTWQVMLLAQDCEPLAYLHLHLELLVTKPTD
ncbi:inclusion body protein [compost metagenome]